MKNVVLILIMICGLIFTESSLSQADRKSRHSVNRELVNIHNDKYADKYHYESQRDTITCKSRNGRRNYCRADTRYGVSFLKQISRSSCDYNWGYDDTGIWVDRGCSARFSINYGWDEPGAVGNIIACSSYDYRRQYCQAYLDGRDVFLLNQISGSSCINNWGYDRNGIWVTNGCRAEFAVEDRSYSHDADITCSSRGNRFQSCPANTQGGVEFVRQLSRSTCNGNWGYDNQGIWVTNGCRAQFRIIGLDYGYGYGHGHQDQQTVRCSSKYRRRKFCSADTSGGVRLIKQRSKTSCRGNWGYDNRGIWVDNGCRATFRLNADGGGNNYRHDNRLNNGGLRPNNRNGRNNGRGNQHYNQPLNTLVCESSGRRKKTCKIPHGANVKLTRQLSKASCVNNWGFSDKRLWVNNGCRAEFTIYN